MSDWKMDALPPEQEEPTLRERAYALRYDPNKIPPPEEICMTIDDVPIASRGNLSGIQGKSKVGKSAAMSAILGAAQRSNLFAPQDVLCMSWIGDRKGAIIHLDTEQSPADWHRLVRGSVMRSGESVVSERLISLPLVKFARSERLDILRQTLAHELAEKGGIDLVLIDGVADLCKSPNDEAESLELVSALMALAQEYNTPIFCIIHENPGSDGSKTRGHLGSELNRKAFANLRIDKDNEGVSTIYGTDMRKRDIPKVQGFCFAWNDAAEMHTFTGRYYQLNSINKEAKSLEKARAEWEPIFECTPRIGINEVCPELSPARAAEIEKDLLGTARPRTAQAMKKAMQRAETLGVLCKTSPGRWGLASLGQTGQERDIELSVPPGIGTETSPPIYRGAFVPNSLPADSLENESERSCEMLDSFSADADPPPQDTNHPNSKNAAQTKH